MGCTTRPRIGTRSSGSVLLGCTRCTGSRIPNRPVRKPSYRHIFIAGRLALRLRLSMRGSQTLSCRRRFPTAHCVFLKKTRIYIQSDSRDSARTARYSRNDMKKMYQIRYVLVSSKIRLNPHRLHTASRNHMKIQEGISLGQRQDKCIGTMRS